MSNSTLIAARHQAASGAANRRPGRIRWLVPLGPPLVLALPLLVGAVRLAANLTDEFWSYGDLAVIESSVRNALRGHQLLGPYSRFGWDHPGPALFYLLAPVYWLGGSDTRALFLSTWLLNAATLTAIVTLLRRQAGQAAAWWATAALLVWMLCVSPVVMMSPWNPNAICLPFLLTLFLSAGAVTGSGWSLAGAAVAGSIVVQIHLGSAPVVAVLIGAGAAGWLWSRRRAPGRRIDVRSPRFLIGVTGLMLVGGALWGPPAWEQLTRDPGNMVLTARFFRDGPPAGIPTGHSPADAAGTVARHASAVPLTFDESGRLGSAGPGRLAVSAAWLVAAATCALLGWRARHRFAFACGFLAATAGVVTVAAATRVADALVPYLFVFTTTLPVAVVAGLGALARPAWWRGVSSRAGPVASTAVVAAVALAATVMVARAATEPEGSSPDTAVTSGLAADTLERTGVQRVMVRETRHDFWPVATGVVAALERHGYDVTVDPLLVSLVGDAWTPTGREEAEVIVGQFDDPVPPGATDPAAAAQLLGRAGQMGVWLR